MGSRGAGAGPGKGSYSPILIKTIPPHPSPRHSASVLIQMLGQVDSKKQYASWADETCSNIIRDISSVKPGLGGTGRWRRCWWLCWEPWGSKGGGRKETLKTGCCWYIPDPESEHQEGTV